MSHVSQPEPLKIRPYARLLTMLGDQLIKNERIALMELIKNSYDADAEWAKVTFEDFGKKLAVRKASKIIIEDDGVGMTENVIRKAWMSPATPNKRRNRSEDRLSPTKGRTIQGEKGIGRFAVLKLGKRITVTTRPMGSEKEYVIVFDFSDYDPEFTRHRGKERELFLDDLDAHFYERRPEVFVHRKVTIDGVERQAKLHGTRIEIDHLKGRWTESKLEDVEEDALKLQSVFSRAFTDREEDPNMVFDVAFFVGEEEQTSQTHAVDRLRELMETTAVLRIEDGKYDDESKLFSFTVNGKPMQKPFDDFRTIRWCKNRFKAAGDDDKTYPSCGSFGFAFYVFDLKAEQESSFYMDRDDAALIRQHRVYLYRDGIRVYPYGEPDDDWLEIDVLRGIYQAKEFASNDQVVGYVEITHAGNPDLMDKTSREGLVGEGDAPEDFIATLQTFLRYVRQEHFEKYRIDVRKRREQRAIEQHRIDANIGKLLEHADKTGDKKTRSLAQNVQRAFRVERAYLERRADTAEDLAAVGMAVETTSHDIMLMMARAFSEFDALTNAALKRENKCADCFGDLQKVRGMLHFVEKNLRNIQSLFKSSRQRPHTVLVGDVLDKVHRIYEGAFDDVENNIKIEIESLDPPLQAKCTDAVLMQLFINLFDNSLHWLQQNPLKKRNIRVVLDGDRRVVLYGDNGPGVPAENRPYVFEPFFSTKDGGRGLGLYIARQLLDRFDYTMELADSRRDRILPGACFVINFNTEGE